ncbi:MAG: FAD-dependent oxidoreductase [Vicingaceae bacterium]
MQKKVDYLIVGQGIAGSFLAFQLLKEGKTIKVIDKGFSSSSSWVAAGVINPLVLKRLTVTWRAVEFMAYNQEFYTGLAKLIGKNHLHHIPLLKLISSDDERKFWQHRYHKVNLAPFVNEKLESADSLSLPLTKSYDLGRLKVTAWVDLKAFLADFRSYLEKKGALLEESFVHRDLKENDYRHLSFDKVVFCEGAAAKQNPHCKHLPFSFNKGELLTLSSNQINLNEMLKKKVFVLPSAKNEFKVGASYERNFTDEEPTREKKAWLEEQFKEITTADYQIKAHEAGVRPAVMDRRPLLGALGKSNCFVFNGLGSRGCFMAPLLSKELVDYMEKGKGLHPEACIRRFSKTI